jgi:hypothetical protein
VRRAAGVAAALATAAAFALALGGSGGAPSAPPTSAVAIELNDAFSPIGQRLVTGSIPAVADHVRVTSDGVTHIEPVDLGTKVTAGRRHVVIPIEGIGPWQVDVLWGEHRLGTAGGGPTPPGQRV